jgi:cyclopropane fatty-acyl-phospholipid synthase-like methyltransferase
MALPKYIIWQNENILNNKNKLYLGGSNGVNNGVEYHKKTLKMLIDNGLQQSDSILDYGCGTGALFITLKSYLNNSINQYCGNEMSAEAYNFLLENFSKEENFILSKSDDVNTFTNRKFKFIIAFSVFNHMDIYRFENFIKNLHNNIYNNSKIFITVRLMTSAYELYKKSSDNTYYNDRDLNYGYNTQVFSNILKKYNYTYKLLDTTQYYQSNILADLKVAMITSL